MKNMELLNVCYKFFNRFITADILLEELVNIDTSNLDEKDIKEQNKLIEEIKNIVYNTSNEVDEYVIKKKESIKNMIKSMENIPKDDKNLAFLNKQLEKDYEKEMDSYERWFAITDCIDKNEYFNNVFDNLTEYELLEFISQYINAPFPPQISQDVFDKLVKVGIEKDEREWLWRLAFNYEERNFNFDDIVDYFIYKKDGYYLAELISAVGECLNIDNIIDKIDDNDLIKDLEKRKDVISFFVSNEQFSKLMKKVDNR